MVNYKKGEMDVPEVMSPIRDNEWYLNFSINYISIDADIEKNILRTSQSQRILHELISQETETNRWTLLEGQSQIEYFTNYDQSVTGRQTEQIGLTAYW